MSQATQTGNLQDLILVDERDRITGYAEKMLVHQADGQLHRAFSVLIFNSRREMLLQLRSTQKYHFGGLWSNACCGHPTRNVSTRQAAEQRLEEEFGFRVPLEERFSFIYHAHDALSGLSERELDHVLVGEFDGIPQPNPEEIDQYQWVDFDHLLEDVQSNPQRYTPWFRILLEHQQMQVG